MNCKKATELISLNCEQKLKITERIPLHIHLSFCSKCRYFKHNNEKLRNILKAYCHQIEK